MKLCDCKPGQRVRLIDGRVLVVSSPIQGDVWARRVVSDAALVRSRDKDGAPLGEIEVVRGDQEAVPA